MLTVRGLIEDLGVRLRTGESNLDMPVRWVHMSEWADPTPWLSGGEVLLTTGMQLDTPQAQRDFVRRLAEHQLAGLGFGIGLAHEAVPPPLLEVAEELEFPVFEVPYELPFIAITEAAFTQLVNEQYAVLRRALAAQERLERIVLSQRGLEALAMSAMIFDDIRSRWAGALGPARLSALETDLRTMVPGETFRLDVPGWFGS